jgi:hypothetical protein
MGIFKNLKNLINDEDSFKPYDKESFKCKCGCGNTVSEFSLFIEFMNYLYEKTNNIYVISSGFRCTKHNKAVGGKIDSDHTKGLAVDIATPTIEDRSLVVYYAFKFGVQRAIVYTDRKFIHLSINKDLTNPILLWNKRGEVY